MVKTGIPSLPISTSLAVCLRQIVVVFNALPTQLIVIAARKIILGKPKYTDKVLRVDNGLKLPLGDRILNSFPPLHFGTFGGFPTRIFYVFVGLTPLILFVTGFIMYWYRYWTKPSRRNSAIQLPQKRNRSQDSETLPEKIGTH
ncbi:MAG: PepSY-associated TM helix domain-containing protein [Rhizonema sp. PD37]|nr:PepSY-associated TM helix domain-containing protein [Rhizonema sp. PD37]